MQTWSNATNCREYRCLLKYITKLKILMLRVGEDILFTLSNATLDYHQKSIQWWWHIHYAQLVHRIAIMTIRVEGHYCQESAGAMLKHPWNSHHWNYRHDVVSTCPQCSRRRPLVCFVTSLPHYRTQFECQIYHSQNCMVLTRFNVEVATYWNDNEAWW